MIKAIEADDPSRVVQLNPMPPIVGAEDFMMSMLHAVQLGHEGNRFVDELYRRLKLNEKNRQRGGKHDE